MSIRPIAYYKDRKLYLDKGFNDPEEVSPSEMRTFRAELYNLNPIGHADRIKQMDDVLAQWKADQ